MRSVRRELLSSENEFIINQLLVKLSHEYCMSRSKITLYEMVDMNLRSNQERVVVSDRMRREKKTEIVSVFKCIVPV